MPEELNARQNIARAFLAAVVPVTIERKVTLVETPTPLTSSNGTPGLVVADILAYLKSWDVISPNPDETEQAAVFEKAVDQLHADKLKTIREILQRMKRVTSVGP